MLNLYLIGAHTVCFPLWWYYCWFSFLQFFSCSPVVGVITVILSYLLVVLFYLCLQLFQLRLQGGGGGGIKRLSSINIITSAKQWSNNDTNFANGWNVVVWLGFVPLKKCCGRCYRLLLEVLLLMFLLLLLSVYMWWMPLSFSSSVPSYDQQWLSRIYVNYKWYVRVAYDLPKILIPNPCLALTNMYWLSAFPLHTH